MRKIKKHTQAEMFTHVEACKKSNLSQKIYCKRHRIAYSTFQYWAKKFREEYSENEPSDDSPGFIPVKVQPNPVPAQECITNQLHFLFPNGIQVVCPESVRPEVIKTLLNP